MSYFSGKSFLVVGGAGFIGSHTVEMLLKRDVKRVIVYDNFVRGTRENLDVVKLDPRLTVIAGDILDYVHVRDSMRGMDGVFLLAALWLLECVERPYSGCKVNVLGNLNVLEAVRELEIPRLVFASSASVYGQPTEFPMTETHPLHNETFYGATKIAMEQMLRAYHAEHGVNYVALRYFNVYGPRQDYEGAYVGVIMRVLDRIRQGQPPIIFGDGSQSYDFVFVKDVARANLCAMSSAVKCGAFNVATGAETPIAYLVQLILALSKSELQPEYRSVETSFVDRRVGSTLLSREQLGFFARVVVTDGILQQISWYNNARLV